MSVSLHSFDLNLIMFSRRRTADALHAFQLLQDNAVGLCTDSTLLPALHFLYRYGGIEGFDAGLNLLIHGCGIPASLPMAVITLCVAQAEPIAPQGVCRLSVLFMRILFVYRHV